MTDVELLPLPSPQVPFIDCDPSTTDIRRLVRWYEQGATEYARANVSRATARLQAENERLRAEVREAREFRDKMANAIGNDQLRRFIEKHGEPVPLTIRMQEAEARAERLAEALREWWSAHRPVGWTEDQHRARPYVNLITVADKALTEALLRDQEARND